MSRTCKTPRCAERRHRSERIAELALYAAIVTAPFGGKLLVGPAGVTVSDLALFVAVAALVPLGCKDLVSGRLWQRIMSPLPLFVCIIVSVVSATHVGLAVKELVQLGFYCLAVSWMFSHVAGRESWRRDLRLACQGAVVVGIAGCLWRVWAGADVFGPVYGTGMGLVCCTVLFSCLCMLGATKHWASKPWVKASIPLAVALVCVMTSFGAPETSNAETVVDADTSEPAIPQQYLEGYAALSVVGKHPLFGVGPGNYQTHIGAFFQGMPKDNTIVLGTRIGYGVILASMGVLGLAAFLYWVTRIWSAAGQVPEQTFGIRAVLTVLCLCGFLTPLFVGRILLPLTVVHGLASGGGQADA